MTDDLEPTLQRHLRNQADKVHPRPDLDDLHRRVEGRDRSRRRTIAAMLAVAVAIGPLGGFVLGRASSAGNDSLSVRASGGGGTTTQAGGASSGDGGRGQAAIDYVGPPLDLLGERITSQGIHLAVRAGATGEVPGGCAPDRVVRVGVVGSDALVGSVLADTYPPDVAAPGLLRLTGLAEGRPVLVGILRTSEGQVSAEFPDGTIDTAEVVDGVAVVAAFATPGATPDQLLASTIRIVDAPAGTPSAIDGTQAVPACNEEGVPPVTTAPVDEVPALPDPGEQPADPAAADAQVRAAYEGAFDWSRSQDEKAVFIERPEVWRDGNQQLLDGPYGDVADDLHAEVDEVVFTDPTHASVRFQLVSSDERVPRYQIGDAVLVDGRWLVAITTPCGLLTLAGVHCNMDL